MSRKTSKPRKSDSRNSRVLAILGVIVILSFVIGPLLPEIIGQPTDNIPTVAPAATFAPTASPTVAPTATSALPQLPTPGQAPAPSP
jgi:hypothetical protein